MWRNLITVIICLFAVNAQASSYSTCHILGVVEDVYFNKIHFRSLKVEDQSADSYDEGYTDCSAMKDKVVAIYDKSEDAAEEPCEIKISADFTKNKIRHRWKDNVQKGDMLEFDYTYYQAMTPQGSICIKEWVVKDHVPLHPHSR